MNIDKQMDGYKAAIIIVFSFLFTEPLLQYIPAVATQTQPKGQY
jgi:hypothetical protein